MVTYWDDDYPLLLKKIYDVPVLLYIKGEPLKEKEDCVAIVGTRRFTPYGKSATQTIAKDLASRNIAVVSSLARGIDTIAHKTAVQTGGRTLAVLGSGRINDPQSVGANRLIRNGATLVSSGVEIIREINPRLFHPMQPVKKSISIKLTDQEQLILEVLRQDPVHIDALDQSVDMDITSLPFILLKLELKNTVQQIGGKQFVRA